MAPTYKPLSPYEVEQHMANAYTVLERQLESNGILPPRTPTVMQRLHPLFELVGAIQLGFLTASLVIFSVFIVVNLLFHLHL